MRVNGYPVEPTILYVVNYYPNNAENTEPTITETLLRDYNLAVARGQEMIKNANNVGVVTVNPITATVIYPRV